MSKWQFFYDVNLHSWGLGVAYYPKDWFSLQIGPFFLGFENDFVKDHYKWDWLDK